MAVPPEVAFNRFFQELYPYVPPVRPEDRDPRLYRGRHDLSGLPPTIQTQLHSIQEMYNGALDNEKQGVPEHVKHPPFHVDYVDSSIQNALAFRHESYSFIALTLPLIFAISDVCMLASKSAKLAILLGVQPSPDEYNDVHAVLFYMLAGFVVGHEWTHHVHGHVSGMETVFPDEVLTTHCLGDIEGQVKEIAADGYSAFHVLTNFIEASSSPMLTFLPGEDTVQRDQVLFSLFVIAVGAYLFFSPAPDLARTDLYTLTHPPQAVRMRFIMFEASIWCQHNRPGLDAWMRGHFLTLMGAVAEATLGAAGARVWAEQLAFLRSEAGIRYTNTLEARLKAYKEAL